MSDNARQSLNMCKHCGGILIDRLNEISCVMCGRSTDHICENCQFLAPEESMGVEDERSGEVAITAAVVVKPRKRKRATAKK